MQQFPCRDRGTIKYPVAFYTMLYAGRELALHPAVVIFSGWTGCKNSKNQSI